MIIKRISAVPPPPPVKSGDKILVIAPELPLNRVALATVHQPGLVSFNAYLWNVELHWYRIEDEGHTWCRTQEGPEADAFRTVVALRGEA